MPRPSIVPSTRIDDDGADEKPPTHPNSTGHRRLADFMAWDPRVAIFQRFRAANALNLLGLQAEIARIEKELLETTLSEEKQHPDRRDFQLHWAALQDAEDENSRQRQLVLQLREALREYNTALVQQFAIEKQPSPTAKDLHMLCRWIENPYGLASGLRGADARFWFETEGGRPLITDKLSLWPEHTAMDGFSQFALRVMDKFAWALPAFSLPEKSFPASDVAFANPSPDKDARMVGSGKALSSVIDKLVTVLSCAVITLPIIVLHFVKTQWVRLVLIVVFALIFSSVLSSVSDASRKEIFAAVAAFAAVQVVFVGTAEGAADG